MQVKKSPNEDRNGVSPTSDGTTRKAKLARNPADDAGKTKVDFYQTNKWVVGYNGEGGEFVAHKHTVPQPLEKAFIRSPNQGSVDDEYGYDHSKFVVDDFPDVYTSGMKNSRVEIISKALEKSDPTYSTVANVQFVANEFIVKLLHRPKTGVYPFSKEDLLRAITSAKWELEMYGMPQEPSPDDEAKKA